jgi:hypothetical protein
MREPAAFSLGIGRDTLLTVRRYWFMRRVSHWQ